MEGDCVTGPRALVLGVVLGALRVPAEAIIGPETVEVFDGIAKFGAAAGVAFGAYKYLLRPFAVWTNAKAHEAVAYARIARALPERLSSDDSRHGEILELLDTIAGRLDDGAELMGRHAQAIERIETHLGLPLHRDAA